MSRWRNSFSQTRDSMSIRSMTRAACYVMPGEHLPHLRTLMAWPDLSSVRNKREFSVSKSEVVSIANAISRHEPVTIYASSAEVADVQSRVRHNVAVVPTAVSQLWIRDSGPVFSLSQTGALVGIDFGFNYWGDKLDYNGKRLAPGIDQDLARHVLAELDVDRVQAPIVGEGGCFVIDGEGTLLATESSLINTNRNPGMSKADVDEGLRRVLGIEKFIWLTGLSGKDITDCHVDALARFVCPATVLLSKPNRNSPPGFWTQIYEDARRELEGQTDAKERNIVVRELEEADVEILKGGKDDPDDMCVSYLNYYLCNGGIIIPKFGDPVSDRRAKDVFEELFPSRRLTQVYLNMLPRTGGGIHCATQQVPDPHGAKAF